MGFSAKAPGSSAETLFIDDLPAGAWATSTSSTMTLQRFGPFAGTLATARSAELTGTGNASLFGFFAGSPLTDAGDRLRGGDRPVQRGRRHHLALPTVDTGSDWAFSFWGGDFYLYTANKYDMNDPYTTVSRYRPERREPHHGLRRTSASASSAPARSTCAPTTPAQ